MKYQDKKLGRYRKGVVPLKQLDWIPIQSKYDGKCAICKHHYFSGENVLYSPTSEPGKKIVHTSCYMTRNDKKRKKKK